MGKFISKLVEDCEKIEIINTSEIKSCSIFKLKEYQANYQMICESFSINYTEFEQIFGSFQTQNEFYIWDTDANGLIDSFELFTGLILYADCSTEEKIKSLFDLFDFNHIQSIAFYDLCYLIECCISSSFKMHRIGTSIPSRDLEEYLSGYFFSGERCKLDNIVHFMANSNEVKQFLTLFRINPITKKNKYSIEFKIQKDLYNMFKNSAVATSHNSSTFYVDAPSPEKVIHNPRFDKFRNVIQNSTKRLMYHRSIEKPQIYLGNTIDYNLKLSWVYGIKITDVKKPCQYLNGGTFSFSFGKMDPFSKLQAQHSVLVYSIGKVVIIYYCSYNRQKYYLAHDNEVISITVSKKTNSFVASGEIAQRPAIHIWDSSTRETLMIIKGHHIGGIHLLSFSQDERFLISVGKNNTSPVLIHEWRANQIVFSFMVTDIIQDLRCVYFEDVSGDKNENVDPNIKGVAVNNDKEKVVIVDNFVLCSLKEIAIVTIKDNIVNSSYVETPKEYLNKEIITIYAMKGDIGLNDEFKNQLLMMSNTLKCVNFGILVGYMSGEVCLFSATGFVRQISKFESAIVAIDMHSLGIIIGTASHGIHILNRDSFAEKYELQLNSLDLNLIGLTLYSIDIQVNKMLLVTYEGDIVEIDMKDAENVNSRRINSVIKIYGKVNSLSLITEVDNNIIFGGDSHDLQLININTNEPSDLINIGKEITSVDSVCMKESGFVTAVGCSTGEVYIRINFENELKKYDYFGDKCITDVKFGMDNSLLVVCTQDKDIFLLSLQSDGTYVKMKSMKTQEGFPMSVNFDGDFSRLIILTSNWKFTVVNLDKFVVSGMGDDDLNTNYWISFSAKYAVNPKATNSLEAKAVVIGNKNNFVACSDEGNNLFLWRDPNEVMRNSGLIYRVHQSHIQTIKISSDDKYLISSGFNDHMICKWKIVAIKNDTINVQSSGDASSIHTNINNTVNTSEFIYGTSDEIEINDINLISELNYSFSTSATSSSINTGEKSTKNSFSAETAATLTDNGIMVRGFTHPHLNNIFSKLLTKSEKETLLLHTPTCLLLEYIYGAHTCEQRNSVKYLHRFKNKEIPYATKDANAELVRQVLNEEMEKKTINEIIKEINFSRVSNKEIHKLCTKSVLYYNSRFVIMLNSNKKTQKVYQGHQEKVSAVAINSDHTMIASGEVCPNPLIYVWKAETLETMHIIRTGHQQGILHLCFSSNDKYLISIGFGLIYSMQIFCIQYKTCPIYINLGNYPIFSVKCFTSSENIFITLGYKRITIWKIKGNLISRTNEFEIDEQKPKENLKAKCFLCGDFLDYTLGNSVATDIIIGSNYGDITGISCGKYILLKSAAHRGSINCLKVTSTFDKDKYHVVTVGEDSFLKIWDQFYNIIKIIDIFKVTNITQFPEMPKGIQSLDLYTCEKGALYILLGIRSGDLIEILFSDLFDFIREKGNTQVKKTNTQMQYNHIYSYPYSYSLNIKYFRTKYAIHPLLPIVCIVSIDQTLRLYDFERKETILVKNLGSSATCINFSPDGKLLSIGTIFGKVMIINSEIIETIKDSKSYGYQAPSLEPIQFIQLSSSTQGVTPVLLTQFSSHGDFLAISYDNKISKEGKPLGGNTLSIYMLRLSKKLNIVNKRTLSTDLYLKYCDITIPDNQYQLANLNKIETATTAIDFSEDDLFVLLTHQHSSLTRELKNKDFIFIVWDLAKNQITVNQERIHSLNFPKFTTSNAIYSRNLLSLYSDDSDKFDIKKITDKNIQNADIANLTSVWQSLHSLSSIAGGANGALYLFRSLSFVFDSELINNFGLNNMSVGTNNKLSLTEMGSTRPFSAHIGAISKIDSTTDERFIFTTSAVDQCVIQWFLMNEDSLWDLDFYPVSPDIPDPFMDIITYEVFKALQSNTWKNRNALMDIYNEIFDDETKISLDLVHIYGRRANDKRNNLKYDNSNRIIYSISSYIVFLTISPKGEMIQEFFVPVENINAEIQMEVSTFVLSHDKREIVIGFNGAVAAVSLWELATQIPLAKVVINYCSVITILRYSHSKTKIIGYGLHKKYYAMVFMIDVELKCVIASTVLIHTVPCKIKDMDFVDESNDEFYTVGIQHLALWNLRGRHLEYRNIPLKILKAFSNEEANNETEEIEENKYGCYLMVDDKAKIDQITKVIYKENPDSYIKCSFLNIATFKGFAILGSDDGNLYTLEKVDLTTKSKYHNSPIIALEKNVEMNFLVSGSMDGRVILFKVDQAQKLKLFKIFRTVDENLDVPLKEILASPENNVQSIGLGMNKIAVGTRSGDILEFQITDDMQIINPNTLNLPIGKVNFQDHDPPISISLDNTSNYFFSITSKGFLSVWNIKTFNSVYSYDFKINSKFIYHFKYQNKLLIAFENFISVLDTSENEQYKKLPLFDLQTGEINDVKISPNEKLLAVASLVANSNPVLDVYDIVNGFVHKNQVQNLNTRIRFLDFSKESTFILLEDYLEEVLVIDIEQKTVVTNKGFFDMEWMGDGLKYSENFKNIHVVYGDKLKSCKIIRHEQKDIVAVGDNLGCVRLFKYPAKEEDKCFLCRTDHTGKISNIFFSFDNQFLITSSDEDKAAFIYRIKSEEKEASANAG